MVREELFKGGFRWSKLQGVAVGMGYQGEGGRKKLLESQRPKSLRRKCSVGWIEVLKGWPEAGGT